MDRDREWLQAHDRISMARMVEEEAVTRRKTVLGKFKKRLAMGGCALMLLFVATIVIFFWMAFATAG